MEYQIGPNESVTTAVQRAIQQSTECESVPEKSLYEVVDPDALNSLFAPVDSDTSRMGGRVSFIYADCRITVENNEYLKIAPLNKMGR